MIAGTGTTSAQQTQAPKGWFGVDFADKAVKGGASSGASAPAGVMVTGVYFNSPADKAGIETGDRVAAIDGTAVNDPKAAVAAIVRHAIGAQIVFDIERDGRRRKIAAVIAPRPAEVASGTAEDYSKRAGSNLRAGKSEAALADANRAVDLSGRNVKLVAQRAAMLERLGQRDAAIGDFRRVLSADPEQSEARTALQRLGFAAEKGKEQHLHVVDPATCPAETAQLQSLASGLEWTVEIPSALKAGDAITLRWRASERFPRRLPVFVAFAINGPVRVNLPPPTRKDENDWLTVDLPGALVLPEATSGPLGLAFGSAKSRVLVPLSQPGSRLIGTVSVRVFDAGPITVESAVIAVTSCGERVLKPAGKATATVAPGTAEIVVQDPYDGETPKRVLLSNSGRYRVNIFDGRYRVFEMASGAKVIDRAGHNPNFSPTERFVVADVGEADGVNFEVIDMVSREVVAAPVGPFVGWTEGDAFMLDAEGQWGRLSITPTLLSRREKGPAVREDDTLANSLRIPHGGHCHACRSWMDAPFLLDLDNGIVAMLGSQSHGDQIYELASGELVCCDVGHSFDRVVGRDYEIYPLATTSGWRGREQIRFSHTPDPGPGSSLSDGEGPILKKLDTWKLAHRSMDPATAVKVAAAATGPVVRGDWRSAVKIDTATPLPATAAERLLAQIRQFTASPGANQPGRIDGAAPLSREEIPYSNSYGDGMWRDGVTEAQRKVIEAKIKQRTAELTKRLLNEIPALRRHVDNTIELMNSYPINGELGKNKINLSRVLRGAWRWTVKGKPLWLLQLHENMANFSGGAMGALLLLEGDGKDGRVIEITKPLESFWSNDYGKLVPQLTLDRYLVMASIESRNLAVYDLATRKVTSIIKDATQADLLDHAALTTDARHLIQLNKDGQVFLYETASGRQVLGGRSIDDEIILYTPQGYYWSTYEGAHFVQLRFPGLPGVYAFKQFAAALDRPDAVRAQLAAGTPPTAAPPLVPPPTISASLAAKAAPGAAQRLAVSATSPRGLARITVYQDGQLIAQMPVSGSTFAGEIAVTPAPHARRLSVLAADTSGTVSLPTAFALQPAKAATNQLFAILVGIDAYSSSDLPPLKYAASDARRLASVLRSPGGTAYYSRRQVDEPLLDDRATNGAILAAIKRAVDAAKPEDTILFSFAGHGLGSGGQYYMALQGTQLEDLPHTGLAWSEVAKVLQSAKARVVVVLDSCQSGLTGAQGLATNDEAASALLTGARSPILVLAASKGRQDANEDTRWGGGLFTFALAQVLQGNRATHDLDGNGTIEVSELYAGLKSIVMRESNGTQTPWLARGDLIGDFALF